MPRRMEKIGEPFPEFDRIFANIGNPTVAQASVVYRTVDWDERKRTTIDMAQASCSPSSTRCRVSTSSPSRRLRWGRVFAIGR
jgi:hypothetical protein